MKYDGQVRGLHLQIENDVNMPETNKKLKMKKWFWQNDNRNFLSKLEDSVSLALKASGLFSSFFKANILIVKTVEDVKKYHIKYYNHAINVTGGIYIDFKDQIVIAADAITFEMVIHEIGHAITKYCIVNYKKLIREYDEMIAMDIAKKALKLL